MACRLLVSFISTPVVACRLLASFISTPVVACRPQEIISSSLCTRLVHSTATCYLRMRRTVVLFDQASTRWVSLVWCYLPDLIVVCGNDLNSSSSVECERRFLSVILVRKQLMIHFHTEISAGISRDSWHKRRATGGKRKPIRKKRKFELGRPAANTKVCYSSGSLVLRSVENVLLFIARGAGFIWE